MKAVVITKDNKEYLAVRFAVEPDDINDRLPSGMILVTDFGNDINYDVVSQELFDRVMVKTGVNLLNDFFEVEWKTVIG